MKDNIQVHKIYRTKVLKLLKEKEKELEKMKANRKQHIWIEKAIQDLRIMRAYRLSCDMVVITAYERDKAVSELLQAKDDKIEVLLRALKLKSINEMISLNL